MNTIYGNNYYRVLQTQKGKYDNMIIKEQLGFVIKEGENMFEKGYKNDVKYIFDIKDNFDKKQIMNFSGINYDLGKYISDSSLKGMLSVFLLDNMQRGIDDDIKDFFNWLADNLNNDMKAIKRSNYEFLYEEYCKAERLLRERRNYISKYYYLNLLDYDSIQRLKKIFTSYKEEYEIFKDYEKDIAFYNDLLGWYKDIPDDLIMFIENLCKKQFENYINSYMTVSNQIEILNCDGECNFAA